MCLVWLRLRDKKRLLSDRVMLLLLSYPFLSSLISFIEHRLSGSSSSWPGRQSDSDQMFARLCKCGIIKAPNLVLKLSRASLSIINCALEVNKTSCRRIPPTRLTPPFFVSSVSRSTFCLHRNKRIRVILLWRLLQRGSASTISNLALHTSSSSGLSACRLPPRPCPPPRSRPLPLLLPPPLLQPPPPPLLHHRPPPRHPPPLRCQSTTERTALPWSCRHLASVSSRFTPPPTHPPHFLFTPSPRHRQPDWDRGFV